MLAFLSFAVASPLALLALDGRGVDATTAEDATGALRDALVADGRLDVMLAAPIAEALGQDHESDLKKARERYAAGRKAFDSADSSAAIAALTEAIRLHDLAGSSWVRRAELADARWLMALCLLREGRVLDGRAQLVEVAELWPGYGRTRGAGSSVALRMLDEVEAGLAKESWKLPDDSVLDALFRELDPGWLAFGAIDGAGGVVVYVVARDGGVDSVDGVVSLPIDNLDEGWTALAAQIAESAGNSEGYTAAPEILIEREEPAPDDDFSEPIDGEPDESDRTESDSSASSRYASPAAAEGVPVKIRERGSIRYDDRPVTSKWWFWTAIVAAVGGTTTAVYVLSQPPEVVQVYDQDTFTVSVQTP